MENNAKLIRDFEEEQLESFINYDAVICLINEVKRLGLDIQIGISKIEEFNPKECQRTKLIHVGFLYFEILYNGKAIEINNDDFGSLGWSEMITQLKLNGKYKLFSWNEDNEFSDEIKRILNFLKSLNHKEELASFIAI